MKYTYPDELSWMEHRERVQKQQFFTRNGFTFVVLALGSGCYPTTQEGYDLYKVKHPETKEEHIAMIKWMRQELAGQVTEEITTRPIEDAAEMLEFFNTRQCSNP